MRAITFMDNVKNFSNLNFVLMIFLPVTLFLTRYGQNFKAKNSFLMTILGINSKDKGLIPKHVQYSFLKSLMSSNLSTHAKWIIKS